MSDAPEPRRPDDADVEATEHTPLLQRDSEPPSRPPHDRSASSALFASISPDTKGVKRRWPSLLALLLLCIVAVLIIVFAFLTPSIVEQYAQQAITFEPTSLSIDSITSTGVRARVQGDFTLDSSKVEPKSVRDIGRWSTWVASKAQSEQSTVEVSLPERDDVLGTAIVPPIVVSLRDGEVTHVDFIADLRPGKLDGIRRLASDWIEGRLGQLRVLGKAEVPIKSGIFNLGVQKLTHELLFANKDIPTMPAYKIKRININDTDNHKGLKGDASVKLENPYPIEFSFAELMFDILVDNCQPSDDYIKVASLLTLPVHVEPKKDIELRAEGYVATLPEVLTQACPGKDDSPLDLLLGSYIDGKKTTVYVRGYAEQHDTTPTWLAEILKSVTVPINLPGKTFDNLIKNFTMSDTQFSLPSPWAEPGTPEAQPRVSTTMSARIAVPEEMNFDLDVSKVRANATVKYHNKELGIIDLRKWQPADSHREEPGKDGPTIRVDSKLKNVPLYITDEDVFSEVIEAMLFGSGNVMAKIEAAVDVQVDTSLGGFTVRNISAEGMIPIKPIQPDPGNGHHNSTPSDLLKSVSPKIYDLAVLSTTPESLTLSALLNFSNPTEYEADVPFISLHILVNDTLLGNAFVENAYVSRGNNTALKGNGTWDPVGLGGSLSTAVEFLSQYISGYNTSLQLRFHNHSVPSNPALSRVLSRFNLTIPTPRLPGPSGGSDEDEPDEEPGNGPRFIDSARFHLFSSTADFVLLSPLPFDTMIITDINATATYKGHRVGTMESDEPFTVQPINSDGEGSLTPRLPVVWETGGVGWDAVRRALGGRLKLAAEVVVGIRIGKWTLSGVWFQGRGLGVGVGP